MVPGVSMSVIGIGERAVVEIEIGGARDVGVDAARAVGRRLGFVVAGTDVVGQQLRRHGLEAMALPEQFAELGAEAPLGALAHDLELRAQQIGLETGHEALGEFPQAAAALGQFLPLIGREKMEHRRVLGRRRAVAEVQRRHHRRPGIDVGGQETRAARPAR